MRWIVGTLFTSEIHNYAYRKIAQINYGWQSQSDLIFGPRKNPNPIFKLRVQIVSLYNS